MHRSYINCIVIVPHFVSVLVTRTLDMFLHGEAVSLLRPPTQMRITSFQYEWFSILLDTKESSYPLVN